MTRAVVVLVALALELAPSSRAYAGCNAFPSSSSANANNVAMTFNGARGTLGSPFVIPTDSLRIARRTCDLPANTTFPTTASDVRALVVIRPPSGKARILVLKPDVSNGPCGTDDFTTKCQQEVDKLNAGAHVDCFAVKNYTVTPTNVDIDLPDPNPAATPTRSTSARAAVVVLTKDDDGTVCEQLAQPKSHCSDAITAQPKLLACVDEIGNLKDPINDPCGATSAHAVFPEVTLLPVPNDVKSVCHDATGGSFCDVNPVDELRYAVDPPGDLLVPMSWKRSLDDCPGQSLVVAGEMRSPSPMQVPDNVPNLLHNQWLESYTFDGRINVPAFTKEVPDNAVLNRFKGTSDEDLSVLRFGARFGECSSSTGGTELCNYASECSNGGDTCDPRCLSGGAACTANQPCASGPPCGRLFDFGSEYANGRWKLGRKLKGFCEDDPTTLCRQNASSCGSGVDCVSYLLSVGPCESPDAGTPPPPGPSAPPPPPPPSDAKQAMKAAAAAFNGGFTPNGILVSALPPEFGPLITTLGLLQNSLLGAAASAQETFAMIVPIGSLKVEEAKDRVGSADQCRALGMPNVLVVASGCSGSSCPFVCPKLGAGAFVNELRVDGSKVRVLQFPEAAGAAPGMIDGVARFFRRMFGGGTNMANVPGTPEDVLLSVADAVTKKVIPIGQVVFNDTFNPFRVSPSGGTKLLAKVGRCVTDDGRTLGVPSFCKVKEDCPAWATCKPGNVVMNMDLVHLR